MTREIKYEDIEINVPDADRPVHLDGRKRMSITDLCNADLRILDPNVRDRAAHTTVGDTLAVTITPKPLQLDYRSDPWGALGRPPTKPEDEHRNLSQDQLDYLDRALGDIPALLADLEVAATKQVRFPAAPTPTTDGTEAPLPFSTSAADTQQQLSRATWAAAGLVWHRLTSGSPNPFNGPVEAARWLQANLTRIATDPAAEELYARITEATVQAHSIIDRPPGLLYKIPCRQCQQPVNVLDNTSSWIQCGCGWAADVTQELQRLLTDADDRLLTAGEILAAGLTIHDRPVTRDQIDGWARRGRLTTRQQKRWAGGTIVATRTFRVGDVITLITDIERRRTA